MTIKTHGRMFTDNTVGITQLALEDGTANQAIVTDGSGTLRFATVGAGGSVGSSVYVEDIRTGDGTTTTFTLSTGAPYEESILVFIDGVAQPTSSFTLPSTTSITFSPAPGNGAAIRICHLGIASSVGDCSITGPKICMGSDAAGDILFYNGTTYQRLGIGTALQVLITNAAVNAVEWVDAATAALPAVGADGNVLTSDGTNWNSEPPLGGVGGELVSMQSFTASGTWTRPSGVKRILVQLVGAGGNSTSGTSAEANGGGGGGACAISVFDVTNLASATVSIGSPAADSTFAGTGITTMIAPPGGSVASGVNIGGAGGTATGGQLNISGGKGVDSLPDNGGVGPPGGGVAGGPIGGVYGRGAQGGRNTTETGGASICHIYEYSDVSASLVGSSLVSTQLFDTINNPGNPYGTTWTKPAGVTKIEVFVIGGGGSATVDSGLHATGNGGGAGTAYSILDVTNITSATMNIGRGGYASNFAMTGITTLNGAPGGTATGSSGSGAVHGGGGVGTHGNAANFKGGTGGSGMFGYGKGASRRTTEGTSIGDTGCVLVKEYSDPSLVSGGSLVPTGVVNPYAGATAPAGWLLCFGQAISRTTYSTLFTAIGTTYGVGDGSTTFALPDMRGRAVAGQDNMGGTSADRLTNGTGGLAGNNSLTLGATGGNNDFVYETTSGNMLATTHASAWDNSNPSGWELGNGANVQPTIILNYIIKT